MARANDPLTAARRPRPKRDDSVAIVNAIVQAAIELGDPETSLATIAKRAGVGVASLHRYFPAKSAIYAEVAHRFQRSFLERLRAGLRRPGLTLSEALATSARAAVELPGATPELRRFLNQMLPFSWSEPNMAEVANAAVDEMTSWLAAHVPQPPADLRDRVFIAFAAGRGIVMMSRLLLETAPPDEVLVREIARGAAAYLRLSEV